MIGHSFGGRISILYASLYPVDKLVLCGSPVRVSLKKQSLKVKLLKTMKKIPGLNRLEQLAKKFIGSRDYRHASIMMRQILVNTVNTDLTVSAKKITCPTILIWGTNDQEASYDEGLCLEKILKDGALITYDGCSHYAYLERLSETVKIINNLVG